MHRIDDAIVHGGRIVLSHLPFADGQHVRVVIAPADGGPAGAEPAARPTIHDVRRRLAGGVERFDDPSEPMIPEDDWGMLR